MDWAGWAGNEGVASQCMNPSETGGLNSNEFEAGKGSIFLTTRWSEVLEAARDSPSGAAALGEMCRNYWHPVYAFIRRRGFTPSDAEDLTQSFFAHIIANDALAKVERQKGKFRSFVLAALTNFLTNEWAKGTTLKRGGGRQIVSLDDDTGETLHLQEPSAMLTPERHFERRWALTLIERTLDALRKEYALGGKARLFVRIESGLTDEVPASAYAQWGAELGMHEGAVRVALHRLRRRFGDALRREVSLTVSQPEEIDEEIRSLLAAIGQQ
jgi:RNA polymerase sigma-70 factor (ECF subfamily)